MKTCGEVRYFCTFEFELVEMSYFNFSILIVFMRIYGGNLMRTFLQVQI